MAGDVDDPPGTTNPGTTADNPNTGTPTGSGTPPTATNPTVVPPSSTGTLTGGNSGAGSNGGTGGTELADTPVGATPAEQAQIDATLNAITTSPQSEALARQRADKRAAEKANGDTGVLGSLVVTKIVNRIPDWVAYALAALSLLTLAALGLLWRERRRRQSAEEDAMVDELTGIANRKAFDRRLDLEWRRAARYGRSLGLMVMDLDGFKAVNDINGHAAGDRVLHEVAQRLDSRMRDTDLVARIGGDEFAVICPETGINELMTIRRQLAEHATQELQERVGLSIGVAEYVPGDDDATTILARADESMYRVKRGEAVGVPA